MVGDFLEAKWGSSSPVMPSFPRDLLYQWKNPADLPHPRNSLMQSTEGQSVLHFFCEAEAAHSDEWLFIKRICLFSFILATNRAGLKDDN